MYFVVYVSRNPEQADDVMKRWVEAGIQGLTILESAGMQSIKERAIRDDLGIIPSLSSLLRSTEVHHRTIFTAIDDEVLLQKIISATTRYVKDWSLPDVGILLVLPLLQAYGIHKGIPKRD